MIHYPVYGGPHNNIARLHGPLADLGVDLRVALPSEPGNATGWMRSAGVPVVEIPLSRLRATRDLRVHCRFVTSFVSDVFRIARMIHRQRIDVVLLPGLVNPHAALAGRLLGKPVVWQILDTRTPLAVARVVMPIVDRLADTVMFWGEALAKSHGDPQLRVPVVFNSGAVETAEFRPSHERRVALREQLGIPGDAVVVGAVASWYPTKGVDLFVEAARVLADQHPTAWFVVVGDPQPGHAPHAEAIRVLASSSPGLCARLRFVSARPDLESVYPAYDVMVVPSRPASEGLATTVLEAMSCGLPVVASDVGATGDAVLSGRTGQLVPAGDATALADALARFITMTDAERHRLGMQSRQLAVERYDVAVAARTHEVAFRGAVTYRQARRFRGLKAMRRGGLLRRLGDAAAALPNRRA